MGKSVVDFDDVQAVENRRREVAVLHGASPRATKYEPSELKDIIKDYVEETKTSAADALAEYQKEHPLPGYNMVPFDSEGTSKEETKKAEEAANQIQDLLEEARENEFKVTDTSTGLPKPEPVLSDEEKEEQEKAAARAKEQRKKEADAVKAATPKTAETPKGAKTTLTPSPIGSGDARGAVQSTENK